MNVYHSRKRVGAAADSDGLRLVAVLVAGLPKRFRRIVDQVADHSLSARSLDFGTRRQVLQNFHGTGYLRVDRLVAFVHAHRDVLVLLVSREDLANVAENVTSMEEHVVRGGELDSPASDGSLLQRRP